MTDEIARLLRAQPLFSGLEDREIEQLALHGATEALAMGRTIFREGERGDIAYLVYAGRLRVIKGLDGREVTLGTLARGDFVGERAALTGEPREASARAAEDAVLVGFDGDAFRAICVREPHLARYFDRLAQDRALINFLRINTFVSALPPRLVLPFMERLDACRFAAGETIFRQGERSDRLFVVAEGQVRIARKDNGREVVLATYHEGDYFGERSLIMSEVHSANATAVGAVRCLAISKASVDALLESVPKIRAAFVARIALYDTAIADGPPPPTAKATLPPAGVLEPAVAIAPDPLAAAAGKRPRRRFRDLLPIRRYPWLPQHDETDCGAASLAMIARYHGKRLPMPRLRDLANIGREGASMYGVASAAEEVGFATRAVRTDYDQLATLALPAIAHWAGFHYVALYEVSERGVVVGDPAVGVVRMSRQAFEEGWSGRLLLLAPTERLARQEEPDSLLRRYLPLLRPHRTILAQVLLATLAMTLLALAAPLFLQTIIDRVLALRNVHLLNLMLGGMVVVVLVTAATDLLRRRLLIGVGQAIGVHMSVDLFRQILRLAMSYFDKRKVGDVLTRFSDNARICALITGDAVGVLLDAVMAVVYLAVMLIFYSASLTLVGLLLLPISVVAALVIAPMIRRTNRRRFETRVAGDAKLIETIRNVAAVKAAVAELPLRRAYDELIVEHAHQHWRSARLGMALHGVSSAVRLLSGAIVLWYGARLVMDGALSVGQLVAFGVLYGMVMAPVLSLVGMWQQMQDTLLSLDRLSDIHDAPLEQSEQAPALVELPALRGHIRFENVSFCYSEEAGNVLSSIDLEVRPGQVLALVGRSGSGKSTLIALLQRLYGPTQGRILIDGIDIAHVPTDQLRRQMGLCLQDAPLLTGTIRDNITLGDPEAAREDVIAAARTADAHAFISGLVRGYDTVIGEAGSRLSGGQRQKVAIARALLRRPPILVLDEATSLLDAEAERVVRENMAEVLEGRTVLIVAHRISTIRDADVIAVLDDGMLVERGDHAELMARRGLYHYLASRQLTA